MTDKQIIIDGYSLKDLKDLLFTGQRDVISTKTFEAIIETLERKEQECEELKENLPNAITRLMGELDQLKAKLQAEEEWHKQADKIAYINSEYTRKLSQTLTEIKEIIKFNKTNRLSGGGDISIEQILQKINEVEGGR